MTTSAKKEFVDQENQAEIVAPFVETEDAGPREEDAPEVNMACMNEQSPVKFNEQVEQEIDEIPDMTPQ